MPSLWGNFGLGEGKTTIRGGYQITYQGGGRFSTLENALTQPPGRTPEFTRALLPIHTWISPV
jgi:hypothetical protein